MDVFVEFVKNKCSQKANYLKLVEINKQKEFIELEDILYWSSFETSGLSLFTNLHTEPALHCFHQI